MAEGNEQEKTEAPTERRREELRREGQFAYSKELPAALILGLALLMVYVGGIYFLNAIKTMFAKSFSNLNWGEISVGSVGVIFSSLAANVLFIMGVFLALLFAVGILAGILQIGFHINFRPLSPDVMKINPFSGLARIFSVNTLVEGLKILIKLSIVAYVGYSVIASDINQITRYGLQDKEHYLTNLWEVILALLFKLFLSFAILAALDYLWQRLNFERKNRMSRQELLDELKQAEGDPLIKARIRQIQQKMSRARMLQEVPKADLVITNPTHYAVVLKYEPGVMAAPQIVAKGLDYLALRIIEIANESGVVVTRQAPLARGLYHALEIGDSVPEEFYAIVAEVLAAAYKAKGKRVTAA